MLAVRRGFEEDALLASTMGSIKAVVACEWPRAPSSADSQRCARNEKVMVYGECLFTRASAAWFMLLAHRTNLLNSFGHLQLLGGWRSTCTLLQQCVHGVSIRGLLVAIRISSGRSRRGACDGQHAVSVGSDAVHVNRAFRIHRGRTGDVYGLVGVACQYASVQVT